METFAHLVRLWNVQHRRFPALICQNECCQKGLFNEVGRFCECYTKTVQREGVTEVSSVVQ